MRAPAFVFFAAYAIGLAPSIIDRARRNHATRKARAEIDAQIQKALLDGLSAVNDRLVCEQLERVNGWAL